MPISERSLFDKYDIQGGEEFREVFARLPGLYQENIGALIEAGGGRLQGQILKNLGFGMIGYRSVATMPTIHLTKEDGSEVPVLLWAYSSHGRTSPVLEVFARAQDLDFVVEKLSSALRSRR